MVQQCFGLLTSQRSNFGHVWISQADKATRGCYQRNADAKFQKSLQISHWAEIRKFTWILLLFNEIYGRSLVVTVEYLGRDKFGLRCACQIRGLYLSHLSTETCVSHSWEATTKKRYSDTTIQRYTEPEPEPELEPEPCTNYANYCLQSPRKTSVIIFSGGEGAYT